MVKRQWVQTIYFGLIQDHEASTRVFLGIIFDKHLFYWLTLHPTQEQYFMWSWKHFFLIWFELHLFEIFMIVLDCYQLFKMKFSGKCDVHMCKCFLKVISVTVNHTAYLNY